MGSKFDDEWSSDNKTEPTKSKKIETKPASKHRLYFAKEKRRGKVVTIVKPFFIAKDELNTLLKSIKKRVGTGGTVRDDSMEFQGDIASGLKAILEEFGFGIKR
jgi:translation initiation factor 1